jgi:signal transduction histidine kinase
MRPENLESVDDRPVVPTAPAEERFVARRANILVVDDTPANLQVLAGMLKDRGYKVRPVLSGGLALLAARRDPPDLILLDIHMPEMSGYEVCEQLKADDALRGIPVIFISALAEQLDKVKAFAVGGVDYLTKPFQMEELHARVETHLKLRRLQLELEETNSKLANANAVLSRKQEELSDLHRRKDEFLAMLSHELRNPLAPIVNAVQILRLQKEEGPIQRQARTIIERQVTQMTRLIDDLMEVSRITTGRVQLRLERVDVRDVVERAVESARPLIDRLEHELTVSPPPEPIWLHADAARLEQVVVNLLTNAAKYTRDGGHLSLTLRREGDECVVRLRDTGVGIAPELLPRIFDLFTQAERSLNRSQGGLGIGLALVQRLVELHRGRVEATSVLGEGSEFVVRLPVPQSDSPPSAPARAEASPSTGPALRVLVVDDNVDAVESMAMLMVASGHDVRTAHDGPAGLKAVIEYGPDVVLLDIGLPGLDGFQVAKRIREHPRHKKAVLVAMTGYGQEADRRRSLEAGFDHHLVKPANLGELREILATVEAT